MNDAAADETPEDRRDVAVEGQAVETAVVDVAGELDAAATTEELLKW